MYLAAWTSSPSIAWQVGLEAAASELSKARPPSWHRHLWGLCPLMHQASVVLELLGKAGVMAEAVRSAGQPCCSVYLECGGKCGVPVQLSVYLYAHLHLQVQRDAVVLELGVDGHLDDIDLHLFEVQRLQHLCKQGHRQAFGRSVLTILPFPKLSALLHPSVRLGFPRGSPRTAAAPAYPNAYLSACIAKKNPRMLGAALQTDRVQALLAYKHGAAGRHSYQ
jgi:hypothetical protein